MEIELYKSFSEPLAAITAMGKAIAKAELFGCAREETGIVFAFACFAERKSPMEILRVYDIVDGKLRMKALAMLAEFRRRGGKHRWLASGEDGKTASIELSFDSQVLVSSFTIEQAQLAGLVRPRSNWEKSAPNMLRARAISNGVNMLCPEIAAGFGGEPPEECAPMKELLPEAPERTVSEPQREGTEATEGTKAEGTAANATGIVSSSWKTGLTNLPAETVKKLIDIVGGQFDQAISWLEAKKWIKPGEGFEALTEGRAQMILERPADFLAKVAATIGKPAATA